MRIIDPIVMSNTILNQSTGSDIPEPDTSTTPAEAVYVAGTTYHTGDQVIVIATHKVYESISVADHSGNYPPTDVLAAVPKWLEVGATNRWKAFDAKIGSKAIQATSVMYQFTIPLIDSIALLGLVATSVHITITGTGAMSHILSESGDFLTTESGDNLITESTSRYAYDETFSLIDNTGVYDWYTYFFEEIIRKQDLVVFDLPEAYGGILEITITNTGSNAEVGEIIIGNATTLGITRISPSIGIIDYSNKSTDDFGNIVIVERAFSKRFSCDIKIDNDDLDDIYNLFVQYRSTPIVWVGSELYESMIVYGFYKDMQIVIPYTTYSDCSLTVEGLT